MLALAGLFAIRYLVLAGIAWTIGYWRGVADRWRKLQRPMRTGVQLRREIGGMELAFRAQLDGAADRKPRAAGCEGSPREKGLGDASIAGGQSTVAQQDARGSAFDL